MEFAVTSFTSFSFGDIAGGVGIIVGIVGVASKEERQILPAGEDGVGTTGLGVLEDDKAEGGRRLSLSAASFLIISLISFVTERIKI